MNDAKAIDNERVPYQLPMPKEALSEIAIFQHIKFAISEHLSA